MNKNRISATVIVIVVVALAIATSSFTSAPAAAGSSADDFGLRHPNGMPGYARQRGRQLCRLGPGPQRPGVRRTQ